MSFFDDLKRTLQRKLDLSPNRAEAKSAAKFDPSTKTCCARCGIDLALLKRAQRCSLEGKPYCDVCYRLLTSPKEPAKEPKSSPVSRADGAQKKSAPVQKQGTCRWKSVPPLSEAVESGNVGMGSKMTQGDVWAAVTTQATNAVKYYYFSGGLLVFAGKGAAKDVDPGGCDGRRTYEPEALPWSDTVARETRVLIVTEGVTSLGTGLLDSLKHLEELDLADSVTTVFQSSTPNLRTLRAGKSFKAFCCPVTSLTELKLPTGAVHFRHFNDQAADGMDFSVRDLLKTKQRQEYLFILEDTFKDYPALAPRLYSLIGYDETLALRLLSGRNLLNYDQESPGRPAKPDLWAIHGLKKGTKYTSPLKVTISEHQCLQNDSFTLLAAMAHAALLDRSIGVLDVHLPGFPLSDGFLKWWKATFTGTVLQITRKDGKLHSSDDVGPTIGKAMYEEDGRSFSIPFLTQAEGSYDLQLTNLSFRCRSGVCSMDWGVVFPPNGGAGGPEYIPQWAVGRWSPRQMAEFFSFLRPEFAYILERPGILDAPELKELFPGKVTVPAVNQVYPTCWKLVLAELADGSSLTFVNEMDKPECPAHLTTSRLEIRRGDRREDRDMTGMTGKYTLAQFLDWLQEQEPDFAGALSDPSLPYVPKLAALFRENWYVELIQPGKGPVSGVHELFLNFYEDSGCHLKCVYGALAPLRDGSSTPMISYHLFSIPLSQLASYTPETFRETLGELFPDHQEALLLDDKRLLPLLDRKQETTGVTTRQDGDKLTLTCNEGRNTAVLSCDREHLWARLTWKTPNGSGSREYRTSVLDYRRVFLQEVTDLLENRDAATLLWDFMIVHASHISAFPAVVRWGRGYTARIQYRQDGQHLLWSKAGQPEQDLLLTQKWPRTERAKWAAEQIGCPNDWRELKKLQF